jgi:hypothetical protein
MYRFLHIVLTLFCYWRACSVDVALVKQMDKKFYLNEIKFIQNSTDNILKILKMERIYAYMQINPIAEHCAHAFLTIIMLMQL